MQKDIQSAAPRDIYCWKMIKGFERETHELTSDEMRMVAPMVNGLKTKIGVDKAITSQKMIKAMRQAGYKIDGPRLRKIVHFIRVNKLVPNLISTSKGYFIATTQSEIDDYKRSLQQRINSISEILNSI